MRLALLLSVLAVQPSLASEAVIRIDVSAITRVARPMSVVSAPWAQPLRRRDLRPMAQSDRAAARADRATAQRVARLMSLIPTTPVVATEGGPLQAAEPARAVESDKLFDQGETKPEAAPVRYARARRVTLPEDDLKNEIGF